MNEVVTASQLERLRPVAVHKGFELSLGDDGKLAMTRNGMESTVTTAREAYRIMRCTTLGDEEQREIYANLYGPMVGAVDPDDG